MILSKTGPRLRMRKTAAVLVLTCAIDAVAAGVCHAQLPPPKADPMAISVGVAWVIPLENLALQHWSDGRYATSGTALTQRFSYAPWEVLGFFLQASFPAFGLDGNAAQRDFMEDPPITGGSNDVTAWNLGARLRLGRSWKKGLYVEAAVGWHRDRLELELVESSVDTTFSWEPGWAVAAGWVFPLGPALAVDAGVAVHEFREEYFVNRWVGLRLLAVMTFGGDR